MLPQLSNNRRRIAHAECYHSRELAAALQALDSPQLIDVRRKAAFDASDQIITGAIWRNPDDLGTGFPLSTQTARSSSIAFAATKLAKTAQRCWKPLALMRRIWSAVSKNGPPVVIPRLANHGLRHEMDHA
ncbi:hypothetical protein [Cupriavidus sp. USMAA2-4]|uniref:hypothetical protein n=1 Tax=Cupriavidus sp. USMAA2-4 TaxID=876364 RepID=UPI003FA499B9